MENPGGRVTLPFDGRATRFSILLVGLALLSGCGTQEKPATEHAGGDVESASAGERHVALSGQPNFRDLGGYETDDGRTVKWGEVYRSGELGHLTEQDVAKLEELELRTVVSFLLPEEIERHGEDRLPEGTRLVSHPIASERATAHAMQVYESIRSGDFDSIPPAANAEFHRLLLEDGKESYRSLLEEVADPANRPLAFHCSQGVHRAGTATAVLLSALGVPWETVREDYVLSNVYRREEIENSLERIREIEAERRGIPPEEINMSQVEKYYRLDGSYIDGSLERAVEEYGSMKNYIRDGLGISDETIEQLRNDLLE